MGMEGALYNEHDAYPAAWLRNLIDAGHLAPGTDWSHVHTRRLHSMRWRLDNSLLLCSECHRWWHENPMRAATWWSNTYPDRLRSLTIMHGTVVKPDLEAARKHLLKERERYVG